MEGEYEVYSQMSEDQDLTRIDFSAADDAQINRLHYTIECRRKINAD